MNHQTKGWKSEESKKNEWLEWFAQGFDMLAFDRCNYFVD